MSVVVIIPFRDRGKDPLRVRNLARVRDYWRDYGTGIDVVQCTDGREGDAQFNRHAAYNRGRQHFPDAEVYVYAEADMLLPRQQVWDAIDQAASWPGMVVPFTQYRYLSPADSAEVCARRVQPSSCIPDHVMDDGKSIGALNVMSAVTLDGIGQFDEAFEGNWYDDNATELALRRCSGPTRWVTGPAYHLYHLPGHRGDHLTDADRAATDRNHQRLGLYKRARTAEQIRELTTGKR